MNIRKSLCSALACVALLCGAVQAQTTPADLTLTNLNVTGVAQPIAVAQPVDGSGRLFIVSRTGGIFIYRNGAIQATPFLTVPVSTASEQGLLGLAFHPNFASNGRFFVQHTRAAGGGNIGPSADQLTVEYRVSAGNPDVADPATRTVILTIGDMAGNHNGGDIHFGVDGYLYVSQGDGGPQNNPHGFAECLWRKPADNIRGNCSPAAPPTVNYALLGKILRIDVDGTTANASAEMCGVATGATANYRIPADNPHTGTSTTCDEIYHVGLRNPFRFSFDRATNDMWIADVGQNVWEELDLIAAGSGPQNLGWSTCEGRQTFPGGAADTCNFGLLPVLNYSHASGRCSVTGGYRYRGPIAPFRGTYVYADFCSREIFFGRPDSSSSTGWSQTRWESAPGTPVLAAGNPIGFGVDAAGNLYLTVQSGAVYRFTSASVADVIFDNGFE